MTRKRHIPNSKKSKDPNNSKDTHENGSMMTTSHMFGVVQKNGVDGVFSTLALKGIDEYHNNATPCSSLLEGICAEIFPEFVSTSRTDGSTKHLTGPRKPSSTKPSQVFEHVSTTHRQPSFSDVIRCHLLQVQKAKISRSTQDLEIQHRNGIVESVVSIHAKKRNKKKKKKKGCNGKAPTIQTTVEEYSDHVCLPMGIEMNGATNRPDTSFVWSPQQSPTSSDVLHTKSGADTKTPSLISSSSFSPSSSSPVPHLTHPNISRDEDDHKVLWRPKAQLDVRPFNASIVQRKLEFMMDRLLSESISPKESLIPSTTIDPSMNGDPHLSALCPSVSGHLIQSDSIEKNRQLTSFLAYLENRYIQYHRQIQEKQLYPQNKITASKGTRKTWPDKRDDIQTCHNESHPSLGIDMITYKNPDHIVPTIRLRDLIQVCNHIKCPSCKEEALQYVRSWTGPSLTAHCIIDSFSIELEPTKDGRLSNTFLSSGRKDSPKRTSAIPISDMLCFETNTSGTFHDDDYDKVSFDYIAMEEGKNGDFYLNHNRLRQRQEEEFENHVSGDGSRSQITIAKDSVSDEKAIVPSDFRFELCVFESDESIGRLLQLIPSPPYPTDYVETIPCFPLSMHQIDMWIRSVILPCGLKDLDKYNDEVLDLGVDVPCSHAKTHLSYRDLIALRSIVEPLAFKIGEILQTLSNIRDDMDSLKEEATSDGSWAHFSSKVTEKLHQCDAKCKEYLHVVDGLLILLHNSTIDARTTPHAYQKWITELVDRLWDARETTLRQLMQPATDHRWKVISLVNRPGSVPLMCSDPVQRMYYSEMLSAKVDILRHFHDTLNTELIPPKQYSEGVDSSCPTQLLRVSTVASLFTYLRGCKSDRLPVDDESMISLLMKAQVTMICETVPSSKVQDMFQKQSQKCQLVRDRVASLAQDLQHYYEHNFRKIPSRYQIEWDVNMIAIEDKIIEGNKYSSIDGNTVSLLRDRNEMRDLSDFTASVMKQSRLRDSIERYDSTNPTSDDFFSEAFVDNAFTSILEIQRNSAINTRASKAENDMNIKRHCVGEGGRRRVSCILSAFIYNWLCDRYREFHADLTQTELLNDIKQDIYLFHDEADMHRAKKTAKRKQKKTISASRALVRYEDTSGSVCSDDSLRHEFEIYSVCNDILGGEVQGRVLCSEATADFDCIDVYSQLKSETYFLYNEEVGIENNREFTPVREYLIERYRQIIGSVGFVHI